MLQMKHQIYRYLLLECNFPITPHVRRFVLSARPFFSLLLGRLGILGSMCTCFAFGNSDFVCDFTRLFILHPIFFLGALTITLSVHSVRKLAPSALFGLKIVLLSEKYARDVQY